MRIGTETPVVVSGGASGLGAAVAEALTAAGAPVGILDLNPEAGSAMANRIGAVFAECNMADPASVTAALAALRARNGQERICVSCAGIAPAARTVARGAPHDPALFAKVMGVNLMGTFNLSSQSAAGMSTADPLGVDGERGVIVNTASIAAWEGQIGQLAYAASKAGVAGMTLPMARDLARIGIRVMAIAPGIFATPMVTAFPQELQDALAATAEFPRRLGDVREFAALVRHIVENPMLNGETIRLDAATRLQAK